MACEMLWSGMVVWCGAPGVEQNPKYAHSAHLHAVLKKHEVCMYLVGFCILFWWLADIVWRVCDFRSMRACLSVCVCVRTQSVIMSMDAPSPISLGINVEAHVYRQGSQLSTASVYPAFAPFALNIVACRKCLEPGWWRGGGGGGDNTNQTLCTFALLRSISGLSGECLAFLSNIDAVQVCCAREVTVFVRGCKSLCVWARLDLPVFMYGHFCPRVFARDLRTRM